MTPKPKSELELRYETIRNSSTQSRAALKSPTQLLKDRLGLSPKKKEIVREFTPPAPIVDGCILSLPDSSQPLSGPGVIGGGKDIGARTAQEQRPAWWCKFDRLVVFDGLDGEGKPVTRSSKGLSVARRRGEEETVVVPLGCGHCREVLRREEWKLRVRVCKRGVCWGCRERCLWEHRKEGGTEVVGSGEINVAGADERASGDVEAGRERADSVLQDQQTVEVDLCEKAGIETGEMSPIEAVGGIEERLDEVVEA
jgi:hypothetical protein